MVQLGRTGVVQLGRTVLSVTLAPGGTACPNYRWYRYPGLRHEELAAATDMQREVRSRACLGGRTSAWVDAHCESGYDEQARYRFHDVCKRRVRRALRGAVGKTARRRAERAAILETMESFGVIRRTRGGSG